MKVLLGLDGGGSRTSCVAATEDGTSMGKGHGGSANYLKEGLYTAKYSIREAALEALKECGASNHDVACVCAGLAGVDRPADRALMRLFLKELFPHSKQVVENDAFVALAGATGGLPGVIVISGTGSIAFGVNERAKRARAGGWGHLLGDEGSGYDIARKGLQAALQAYDGRGPETLILEKLLKEFYLSSIDELVPMLYREDITPRRIASLYPLILACAEEDDAVALKLLADAAQALLLALKTVLRKLGFKNPPIPVTFSGGVFENSTSLREMFEKEVTGLPGVKLMAPKYPPSKGALLIAQAALEHRRLLGAFFEN
ncbi:MAG: hypothetical protein HY645_11985 [Acidobacteria bacterium]|nr:hypothetical protein [Acidobacteriota bacterium]